MIYTELVTLVMGISLLLYVLLGGADFGAGIIEIFTGKRGTETISRAIAPVWEANHIWLIIVVVILFNGFPKAYALISTALHLPIMIVLLGIIARGSAFTFRHYDAMMDTSEKYYSIIFRVSSLITIFFLGVTVAAAIGGTIPEKSLGFAQYYVFPWVNIFTFSTGLFLTVMAAYISGIFLLGEVETLAGYQLLKRFIMRLFIAAVISGGLVLFSSWTLDLHIHRDFFDTPLSLISAILATAMVPIIFRTIQKRNTWRLRWLVGVQVVLIILGWFAFQWPNLLFLEGNHALTIYEMSAPKPTMEVLFLALAGGVMIIFPALYYLIRIFKLEGKPNQGERH